MNFYKHHLGDYDGHTAHLSWDEDMAYTRLMRCYYRREAPIPDSDKYRLTRATNARQRAAVDTVLTEFFQLDVGLWRQKRCDEEIAAYQHQAATNKRIAQQRIVNESSTKGSPAYMAERAPNQNQIPEPEKPKALSGKPDGAPKNGRDYRSEAREILQYLNRSSGHEYREVPANLDPIVARLQSGVSALQVKEVVLAKCDQWLKDENMCKFLRPDTLFNRTKFEQYLGEIGGGTHG